MNLDISRPEDLDAWLNLARQVEHLFGPMADDPFFRDALRIAISVGNAFCIRNGAEGEDGALAGGIIISRELNEIMWLAVAEACRGRGLASSLMQFALMNLNADAAVYVQTFEKSIPEGRAARRLYRKFGFADASVAENNPAGIPTVIMRRNP